MAVVAVTFDTVTVAPVIVKKSVTSNAGAISRLVPVIANVKLEAQRLVYPIDPSAL